MKITLAEIVLTILLVIMVYVSSNQDEAMRKQQQVIRQMAANPACLAGEVSKTQFEPYGYLPPNSIIANNIIYSCNEGETVMYDSLHPEKGYYCKVNPKSTH